MEQLQLDILGPSAVPSTCDYREWHDDVSHAFCMLHKAWTNCGTTQWGETVGCVYDEADNSPEACRRRLQWLIDHEGKTA